LGEFRRVVDNFPQSDAVDESLMDMADAFWRLHSCSDARRTLEALIQTQPQSPHVRRAREKIREIARAPRGYCTSS
ncbi:tetratricopeptide repeat protein, partial [Shigella flexneri]|uniref:tetratricopeptide repeat protein n=1 Tax=Shigella flexneri TaxID=623 RepID=UPI000AE51D15